MIEYHGQPERDMPPFDRPALLIAMKADAHFRRDITAGKLMADPLDNFPFVASALFHRYCNTVHPDIESTRLNPLYQQAFLPQWVQFCRTDCEEYERFLEHMEEILETGVPNDPSKES